MGKLLVGELSELAKLLPEINLDLAITGFEGRGDRKACSARFGGSQRSIQSTAALRPQKNGPTLVSKKGDQQKRGSLETRPPQNLVR